MKEEVYTNLILAIAFVNENKLKIIRERIKINHNDIEYNKNDIG